MVHAVQRNLALIIGMALCGYVCVQAVAFMPSLRGAAGPLVLASQQPMLALVAVLGVVFSAALIAGLAGKYSNAVVGLFVLGIGLYALDGRLSTIAEPAFAVTGIGVGAGDMHDGGKTVLIRAGIETLLLAGFALVAVLVVFRIAGELEDVEPNESGGKPHWLTSGDAIRAAACGLIVIPAVWVVGQSPTKGQMIAAAFAGSLLAGMVGRLVSPHVQPKLLFVAPMVCMAGAQLVAAFMLKLPLDVGYVTRSLWKVSQMMPLDMAAGSLTGVAVGYGWARSFLHHEEAGQTQTTT